MNHITSKQTALAALLFAFSLTACKAPQSKAADSAAVQSVAGKTFRGQAPANKDCVNEGCNEGGEISFGTGKNLNMIWRNSDIKQMGTYVQDGNTVTIQSDGHTSVFEVTGNGSRLEHDGSDFTLNLVKE